MTALPDTRRLFQAMDATWVAAEFKTLGPWVLRRGEGGGKRVSAATTDSTVTPLDIEAAEQGMAAMGQPALFMVRENNADLDLELARQGYQIVDPSLLFAAPAVEIAKVNPAPLKAIPGDAPLAIMREIWASGGVGPARIEVMRRAKGPKTYLFSRHDIDKPGGVAFVAMDGEIAMLHALQVVPQARRSGVARNLLGRAAIWGIEMGAKTVSLATTGENLPAQKLFTGLGMNVIGKYRYRMK